VLTGNLQLSCAFHGDTAAGMVRLVDQRNHADIARQTGRQHFAHRYRGAKKNKTNRDRGTQSRTAADWNLGRRK